MYESPKVTEIGTLAGLTQSFNKIGFAADQYSTSTPLTGSMVPAH